MDRVAFINYIEESNISHADVLTKFFDQYMVLYNLIEKIDKISFINSDNNSVTFQLYCTDSDIWNPIIDRINYQSMVVIYDKCFNVSYANITMNTIDINISLM